MVRMWWGGRRGSHLVSSNIGGARTPELPEFLLLHCFNIRGGVIRGILHCAWVYLVWFRRRYSSDALMGSSVARIDAQVGVDGKEKLEKDHLHSVLFGLLRRVNLLRFCWSLWLLSKKLAKLLKEGAASPKIRGCWVSIADNSGKGISRIGSRKSAFLTISCRENSSKARGWSKKEEDDKREGCQTEAASPQFHLWPIWKVPIANYNHYKEMASKGIYCMCAKINF